MSIALALLAPLALPAPAPRPAPQSPYVVIQDFENLVGSGPIPPDFGRVLNWGNWTFTDVLDPAYPASSGTTTISSTLPSSPITFGEDTIFRGGYVATAEPFAWELYFRGQLVHTSPALAPNVNGPAEFLATGYGGFVDAIGFDSPGDQFAVDDLLYDAGFDGGASTGYCPATANSSGFPGVLHFLGSPFVSVGVPRTFIARNLPPEQFAILLTSQARGFTPLPATSNGTLCLSGQIGRFDRPGQIQSSGSFGEALFSVDVGAMPQGNGTVTVATGETWRFQCWFRDPVGLGSHFSSATEVAFL